MTITTSRITLERDEVERIARDAGKGHAHRAELVCHLANQLLDSMKGPEPVSHHLAEKPKKKKSLFSKSGDDE